MNDSTVRSFREHRSAALWLPGLIDPSDILCPSELLAPRSRAWAGVIKTNALFPYHFSEQFLHPGSWVPRQVPRRASPGYEETQRENSPQPWWALNILFIVSSSVLYLGCFGQDTVLLGKCSKREESRAEHKTLTNGDKDPDKILSLSECSGRGWRLRWVLQPGPESGAIKVSAQVPLSLHSSLVSRTAPPSPVYAPSSMSGWQQKTLISIYVKLISSLQFQCSGRVISPLTYY